MTEIISEEYEQVYKNMYYRLFNRVTDALICNDINEIKRVLINAQQETEEMYLSSNGA